MNDRLTLSPTRAFLAALALVAALLAVPLAAEESGGSSGLETFEAESVDVCEAARPAVVGVQTGQANQNFMAQSGFGAGFVVDLRRRWILTSTDVVSSRAREVTVRFSDHSVASARVLARDPDSSAVLLETDAMPESAMALEFGGDRKTRVGTMVFTLGSPYQSIQREGQVAASLGVVSGRYAIRGRARPKGEVLELSAAVNPGSFGGPVVDLSGRVVGMAIAPYSNSRWLGTAAPARSIRDWVAARLEGGGSAPAKGGYLGVVPVPAKEGLVVESLEPGSAAAGSELQAGDVLVEGGSTRLATLADWRKLLGDKKPGDTVRLKVARSGRELTIDIVLGSRIM